MRCFGVRVSSVLLLCSKKCVFNLYKPSMQKVRNITGKMLTATSYFTIQGNLLSVDPTTNAVQIFQTLIGTVCMTLSANVHPYLNIVHFSFFSICCLSQSFDVRMPSFFARYWIPAAL